MDEIRKLQNMSDDELYSEAKNLGAPVELVREVKELGRMPVVMFTAGGIATPADAAMMMQLGADGVFVGSGIFKASEDEPPEIRIREQGRRAKAIVDAVTHYKDPAIIAEVSKGLGKPMPGLDVRSLAPEQLMAARGW